MTRQERISVGPAILVGKPVIKGTRIAMEFLVELLAEKWAHEQILSNYPQRIEEDIKAALECADSIPLLVSSLRSPRSPQ